METMPDADWVKRHRPPRSLRAGLDELEQFAVGPAIALLGAPEASLRAARARLLELLDIDPTRASMKPRSALSSESKLVTPVLGLIQLQRVLRVTKLHVGHGFADGLGSTLRISLPTYCICRRRLVRSGDLLGRLARRSGSRAGPGPSATRAGSAFLRPAFAAPPCRA